VGVLVVVLPYFPITLEAQGSENEGMKRGLRKREKMAGKKKKSSEIE
jgi:hypothetical protein